MLQEALEVFKDMLNTHGEDMIIRAHIPKKGTYQLIEITDDGFQVKNTLDLEFDKKSQKMMGGDDEDYPLIQTLDYYSGLLEMNKPIHKKVIHSNNYFAIAVKKEAIMLGKLTSEIIKGYFAILRNPTIKYGNKPKARILYESVEGRFGKPKEELINRIEEYVLRMDWEQFDLSKKDYLKIFFILDNEEETKKEYKKEQERYLIPNIYNNNNFNVFEEGRILGVPNNNMGMNPKKPYLENKTRKISVPYLLGQDEVLLQAKFFDYLNGLISQGKRHIYIDQMPGEKEILAYSITEEPKDINCGYYLQCEKEKNEVKIVEAEAVTHFRRELKHSFVLRNYMEFPETVLKKVPFPYGQELKYRWEIRDLLNRIFFEGKLISSSDLSKNCSGILRKNLMLYKGKMEDWFWKGHDVYIETAFDKFSIEFIQDAVLKGNIFDAKQKFNLRWSLIECFDPKRKIGVEMNKIQNVLRTHINAGKDEEWDFSSDEEFSFGLGQAASYFLSLSKTNCKKDAFVNMFLKTNSVAIIRKRLMQMYQKYNYRMIHQENGRVQQLLSHLITYQPDKIYKEQIMAGFITKLLIYEKKEKNKGEMNYE